MFFFIYNVILGLQYRYEENPYYTFPAKDLEELFENYKRNEVVWKDGEELMSYNLN
jgi:hypothetical protein